MRPNPPPALAHLPGVLGFRLLYLGNHIPFECLFLKAENRVS